MAFDIEMIKQVYANFPTRIAAARALVGKPLTWQKRFYTLIYGMVK